METVEKYFHENSEKKRIRLAIFDHVTSITAIVLPVQSLIALCRKHHVTVLIDGAHALGALPIHMKAMDADYYVSNAHKWFCAPKVSFFFVEFLKIHRNFYREQRFCMQEKNYKAKLILQKFHTEFQRVFSAISFGQVGVYKPFLIHHIS